MSPVNKEFQGEYLGYSDVGDSSRNVSTLVQIPDSFNATKLSCGRADSANPLERLWQTYR